MKVIPMEVYDRTCGYFRPVSQMNTGKKCEISERLRYNANKDFKE